MNVDNFLKIGHSHTICQDYILSGIEPFPYIILSDGCSSSQNSDIGARLLCHSALRYLENNVGVLSDIEYRTLGYTTITTALKALTIYFTTLPLECLDATLIVAYKWQGMYNIYVYGDGCIYILDRNKNIKYYNFDYTPNAPAYLRYNIRGRQEYINNNVKLTIKNNENVAQCNDVFTPFKLCIPENEVSALIISSDGITSFVYKDEISYKSRYLDLYRALKYSRGNISYEYNDVPSIKEIYFLNILNEISTFKLRKGPFLNRRVKKVFKEYSKQGFINDDDVSIGCFLED